MIDLNSNTFVCANCKQKFTKGVSDEEALAETEELFGLYDHKDLEVVCDDCFNELMEILSHA